MTAGDASGPRPEPPPAVPAAGHPFRSIVITGASGGIGLALALRLSAPGVTLLLVGRDPARLAAAAAHCRARGATVETAALDVGDAQALSARLLDFDRGHPVDLVVANAGVTGSLGPGRTAEPLHEAAALLRINLEGAVNTVTPLIEPMRARRRGTIALIASLAGLCPVTDQPAYSASKAGLIAWGEALMPWLAESGVKLSIVCPGFVETGINRVFRGARPLEMSADQAAARIVRGLMRGQARIAFPWPLALLVRLSVFAPGTVRRRIVNRYFRCHVERPS